ncbi:hypothetical protein AAU61_17405 [Desulfocarbo indianensis]|nr:hypothetical protein AAU61_17405 [Desulfocarbo indianensis]
MDAAILLKLRDYLAVAHHIPGRIRLKLKPGLFGDIMAIKLARSVDLSSWGNGDGAAAIINTRLNAAAGSLIIDYDPDLLAPEVISELFTSRDAARIEELSGRVAQSLGLKI